MRNGMNKFRFMPDKNSLIWLDNEKFETPNDNAVVGLLLNESHEGCCGLFILEEPFEVEAFFYLKVGKLPCTESQIKWFKEVDKGVYKVGFHYELPERNAG